MHRLEATEIDDLYHDLGAQRPRQIGGDALNNRYNNTNNAEFFRYPAGQPQQQQQPPLNNGASYQQRSNIIRQTTTKSSSIIRKKKKPMSWYGYTQVLFKEFCYGVLYGTIGFLFGAFNQYKKLDK